MERIHELWRESRGEFFGGLGVGAILGLLSWISANSDIIKNTAFNILTLRYPLWILLLTLAAVVLCTVLYRGYRRYRMAVTIAANQVAEPEHLSAQATGSSSPEDGAGLLPQNDYPGSRIDDAENAQIASSKRDSVTQHCEEFLHQFHVTIIPSFQDDDLARAKDEYGRWVARLISFLELAVPGEAERLRKEIPRPGDVEYLFYVRRIKGKSYKHYFMRSKGRRIEAYVEDLIHRTRMGILDDKLNEQRASGS